MRSLMVLMAFSIFCPGRALPAFEPVLEWKFENGIIKGAAWTENDNFRSLRFAGEGDHVLSDPAKPLGIKDRVTIEIWIKPDRDVDGLTQVFGESLNSYLLAQLPKGVVRWYAGSGRNGVAAPIKPGEWNHVAATFDGKELAIWSNGQPGEKKESELSTIGKTVDKVILGTSNPKARRFTGEVGMVRVYNQLLSGEEIMSAYRREAVIFNSGSKISVAEKSSSEEFFLHHPNELDVRETGNVLLVANRLTGLEFRREGNNIKLSRFYGIADKQDFIAVPDSDSQGLFEVVMGLDPIFVKNNDQRGGKQHGILKNVVSRMGRLTEVFSLYQNAAKSSSWRVERDEKSVTVFLEWKNIDVKGQAAMSVTGSVRLEAGDPMTRWQVKVTNRSSRYGIERVRFPRVSFVPIGDADENIFIYPKWRGGLVKNPFAAKAGFGENYHTNGAYYPYYVNMQFFALYNWKSLTGLYFGTFDPAPNMTQFILKNSPAAIEYSIGHFPPNMGFRDEDYSQPYDSVIGPFRGDWYDACRIYRAWATRQSWTAKGKTRDRKDIPRWSVETPLHFYTQLGDAAQGTNDVDENQRIAYKHALEWLEWSGTPLIFNWYGWGMGADATQVNWPACSRRMQNRPGGRWSGFVNRHSPFGNYPAQPALKEMSELSGKLKAAGGYVVPYLCATIYDDGSSENAPYAAELKHSAARDLFGNILLYENLGWNMCSFAPAWRKRLAEESAAVVKQENVGGVYLDTVHGMSQPCYWTPHGHPAAGAATGPLGMHQLIGYVYRQVKEADGGAIIEGEDPAENMIDVMDNVLYQRHLRTENKAPLFAAVYADYIPRSTVGKISLTPAPFYIECASLFTEGAQIGRLTLKPRPASMVLSLTRPEHKEQVGFLARVVGYYKQELARKFMCYGQLVRPVSFDIPSPMPMLAYNSDETGGVTDSGASLEEWGNNAFPALMSGVFLSADNEIGIFIVNAGSEKLDFSFRCDPVALGLPGGSFSVSAIEADGKTENLVEAAAGVTVKDSLAARGIRLYRIKPNH